MIGKKDGTELGYIQVKSCHPDRSKSFILRETHEAWTKAAKNQFVAFVWLGSPAKNEPPRYWIAPKSEVRRACEAHVAHGTSNWERRFFPKDLDLTWENNWNAFSQFMP